MSEHIVQDMRRELDKARDALTAAQTHLAAHAEANAALHCATTVMYSPLHARVANAIAGIDGALERTSDLTDVRIAGQLASILQDLDRCEHGRHHGDACVGCNGGASRGNPLFDPGDTIGYGIHGRPIVLPPREKKRDPDAWRGSCSS